MRSRSLLAAIVCLTAPLGLAQTRTSGGSPTGTVTSIALVGSNIFFSSTPGTPVTGSGTLNMDSQLVTQTANCFFAGPTTGAAATPSCRALVNGDFPNTLAPTFAVTNLTGTGSFNTSGTAGNLSGTQTAHTVYAAPSGSSGTGSFRLLVAGDIPTAIPIGNVGSAGLSGTGAISVASTGVVSCSNATNAALGCAEADGATISATSGVFSTLSLPTAPWWEPSSGLAASPGTTFTQNKVSMYDYVIDRKVVANTILIRPNTPDNTANLYDIGIFCTDNVPIGCSGGSGTLLLHLGATAGTTFAPTNGAQNLAISGAPITVYPGHYVLGITTNCSTSCAVLSKVASFVTVSLVDASLNNTSGGALVTGISLPSVAYQFNSNPWWISLHH